MVYAVVGLIVLMSAYLGSYLRPPEWADELKVPWARLNTLSMSFALVFSSVALGIGLDRPCVAALPVMLYLSVQTAVTDFSLRLAYRLPFQIAIAALGLFFGYDLWTNGAEDRLVIMVVFLLGTSAMLAFPRLMPQGDVRALMLISVTALPVLSYSQTMIAFTATAAVLLTYGIVEAIRLTRKGSEPFWKALAMKVSLPAVPLFLIPTTCVVMLSALG